MTTTMFEPMAKILTPGTKGDARVDHFDISRDSPGSFRAIIRDGVQPGTYARLYVGQTLMMTDTQMEQSTNRYAVHKATGHVLVAGLGLGLILVPMLRKPEVLSVTVIEKYQDVVDLVLPNLLTAVPEAKDKLKVIVKDVLEYNPSKDKACPLLAKYDVIYFDIWPTMSADNLPEITMLKRRYARRVAKGGWMGAWIEEQLRDIKRRGGGRVWGW